MGPSIRSANWSCLACVAALFSEAFSSLFLLFSATTALLSSALDLRVATRASIAIRFRAITSFFFSASVCFAMTLCSCLSSVNTRRSILWQASATVILLPFYISLLPTLARTLRRFLNAFKMKSRREEKVASVLSGVD
jgi:hypothetical protein